MTWNDSKQFIDNICNPLRPTATFNIWIKYVLLSMLMLEWIRIHPKLSAVKIYQAIQKAIDHLYVSETGS